jgi:hypothetical protein
MVSLSVALMEAIKAQGLPLEVLSAGSVSMSDDSVPEPDLSVIVPYDPDADTIGLNELKLAVEISDSTAEPEGRALRASWCARILGVPW